MPRRRVLFQRETAELVRRLPPETKRKVRAALDQLRGDPELGEPLERELIGLRRVRVGRLRIVYRVAQGRIEINAVGPLATVYTELERQAGRTSSDR